MIGSQIATWGWHPQNTNYKSNVYCEMAILLIVIIAFIYLIWLGCKIYKEMKK